VKQVVTRAFFNLNIFDGENIFNGWAVLNESVLELGTGDGYKNLEYQFEDAQGDFLTPKLIDTHVHGGNGSSNDQGAEQMRKVLDFHASHGVGKTSLKNSRVLMTRRFYTQQKIKSWMRLSKKERESFVLSLLLQS
jgi:N-acetylglucosamine-6-phosphate deacetylase